MNIAFAGGGTAGHLYPALCVAEELRRRDPGFKALFLVSKRDMDRENLGEYPFRFEELAVTGFGGALSCRMVPAAVRLLKASKRAIGLLRQTGAQAVVAFGAYVSVAPALAAKLLGLKVIIHEQNAVMGRANRCLLPFADGVGWGLPVHEDKTCGKRSVFTGIPVRAGLLGMMPRGEALDYLGLERGRFTLLVMGGSQGAHAINAFLMKGAGLLSRRGDIQVVHLSGRDDYAPVLLEYARAGLEAVVFPYLKEMEWAYAAADLAVCRCGAMTFAEIAQAGLPAVLIPYPRAVNDHQMANARVFERAGAALVRRESDLDPEGLVEDIFGLKGGEEGLVRMGKAARSLAEPRAAEKLADLIEEVVTS